MRATFLSIFLIALFFSCKINDHRIWFPKNFVESVGKNNVDKKRTLIPVECLSDPFGDFYIWTYGSELKKVPSSSIKSLDGNKHQIIDFSIYLNSQSFTKEDIKKYGESLVCFYIKEEDLMLEFQWPDSTYIQHFVNKSQGEYFTNEYKDRKRIWNDDF